LQIREPRMNLLGVAELNLTPKPSLCRRWWSLRIHAAAWRDHILGRPYTLPLLTAEGIDLHVIARRLRGVGRFIDVFRDAWQQLPEETRARLFLGWTRARRRGQPAPVVQLADLLPRHEGLPAGLVPYADYLGRADRFRFAWSRLAPLRDDHVAAVVAHEWA